MIASTRSRRRKDRRSDRTAARFRRRRFRAARSCDGGRSSRDRRSRGGGAWGRSKEDYSFHETVRPLRDVIERLPELIERVGVRQEKIEIQRAGDDRIHPFAHATNVIF